MHTALHQRNQALHGHVLDPTIHQAGRAAGSTTAIKKAYENVRPTNPPFPEWRWGRGLRPVSPGAPPGDHQPFLLSGGLLQLDHQLGVPSSAGRSSAEKKILFQPGSEFVGVSPGFSSALQPPATLPSVALRSYTSRTLFPVIIKCSSALLGFCGVNRPQGVLAALLVHCCTDGSVPSPSTLHACLAKPAQALVFCTL